MHVLESDLICSLFSARGISIAAVIWMSLPTVSHSYKGFLAAELKAWQLLTI